MNVISSTNRLCSICCGECRHVADKFFLRLYSGSYWQCQTCHFLYVSDPIWLNEAYTESICDADTGLVNRNILAARALSVILPGCLGVKVKCIDIGGGTGLLTRLLRDVGIQCLWHDPYTKNIHARGFEARPHLDVAQVLIAIECLEHTQYPLEFIKQQMEQYSASTFIATTSFVGKNIPDLDAWYYYGRGHGQHISFLTNEAWSFMGKKLGLHPLHICGFHILTSCPNLFFRYFLRYSWSMRIMRMILHRRLRPLTQLDADRILASKSNVP